MTRAPIQFGKWRIYYAPKPYHNLDWSYVHDDYDGAPDANDNRCGCSHDVDGCIQEIKEMEE
tara:strand:- start:497 stop:682 length:186 start_codon:yes stop_codon:yes gene_type:complete